MKLTQPEALYNIEGEQKKSALTFLRLEAITKLFIIKFLLK